MLEEKRSVYGFSVTFRKIFFTVQSLYNVMFGVHMIGRCFKRTVF